MIVFLSYPTVEGLTEVHVFEVSDTAPAVLRDVIAEPQSNLYGGQAFPNGDLVLTWVSQTVESLIVFYKRQPDGTYQRGATHSAFENLDAVPSYRSAFPVDNSRMIVVGSGAVFHEVAGYDSVLKMTPLFQMPLDDQIGEPHFLYAPTADDIRIMGRGASNPWNRLFRYDRSGSGGMTTEIDFGYGIEPVGMISGDRFGYAQFSVLLRFFDQLTGVREEGVFVEGLYPFTNGASSFVGCVPNGRYAAMTNNGNGFYTFQIFDTTKTRPAGAEQTFQTLDTIAIDPNQLAIVALVDLDAVPGPEPEPTCFWVDVTANLVQVCQDEPVPPDPPDPPAGNYEPGWNVARAIDGGDIWWNINNYDHVVEFPVDIGPGGSAGVESDGDRILVPVPAGFKIDKFRGQFKATLLDGSATGTMEVQAGSGGEDHTIELGVPHTVQFEGTTSQFNSYVYAYMRVYTNGGTPSALMVNVEKPTLEVHLVPV